MYSTQKFFNPLKQIENNKEKIGVPHRTPDKVIPKVANKSIPLHFIQANRLYSGDMSDQLFPESWAYIPSTTKILNSTKRLKSLYRRENQIKWQNSRSNSVNNLQEMNSTSENLLRKYIKRKRKLLMRENVSLSTSAIYSELDTKNVTQLVSEGPSLQLSENVTPKNQHVVLSLNQKGLASAQYTTEISQNGQKWITNEYIVDRMKKEEKEKLKRLQNSIKFRNFTLKKMQKSIKQIKNSINLHQQKLFSYS